VIAVILVCLVMEKKIEKCGSYYCPSEYTSNSANANIHCSTKYCSVNDRDTCCKRKNCFDAMEQCGFLKSTIKDICADPMWLDNCKETCGKCVSDAVSSVELGSGTDFETGYYNYWEYAVVALLLINLLIIVLYMNYAKQCCKSRKEIEVNTALLSE